MAVPCAVVILRYQMGEEQFSVATCSNCGSHDLARSYRYIDEDEEQPIVQCLSCGTEYDQNSDIYYKVRAEDFTSDIKYGTFFTLGMKGTFRDHDYEIIGHIRYQEEDEWETATWDEWCAVDDRGLYHYFVQEGGRLYAYQRYIPKSIDLEASDSYFHFNDQKIHKGRNGYYARLVYANGELPWEPEIGEQVLCYDFKVDGTNYSIERSDSEVGIYTSEVIDYREIINAFSLDTYREPYENTLKKRKQFKRKSLVYLAALFAVMGLLIYGCSDSTSIDGVMAKKQVLVNNERIAENGTAVYNSMILYGPFRIDKENELYSIHVWAMESVQPFNLEWETFTLYLIPEIRLSSALKENMTPQAIRNLLTDIDALEEPVESYSFNGDFWDEEGRDSEGYWHESDTTASKNVVIEKDGIYYALLDIFSIKPRKPESTAIAIKSTSSNRYYVIAMIILFLLYAVARSRSKNYNELPFAIKTD